MIDTEAEESDKYNSFIINVLGGLVGLYQYAGTGCVFGLFRIYKDGIRIKPQILPCNLFTV